MRIDTDLREQDRQAVKAYAESGNFTMKGAYTRLLRDALWTRTSLAYFPETDNIGVRWDGHDTYIRTNIDSDKIRRVLESRPGVFHHIYMPHSYALEAADVDLDVGPSIFETRR